MIRASLRRLFFALLLFGRLAAGDTRTLTILHTNDLHARLLPLSNGNGGFAYLAAVIRRELDGCATCILLNAGDLVQGTPVSTIFHGLPVFEIANLFHFDASTLGNHDFDYGWQAAQRFLHIATYPVVSANITDAQGRLFAGKPYVILNVNRMRVAVIGAMTEDLKILSTPKLLGPWHADPVLPAIRRVAAEARAHADVIVLLAHLVEKEELELLRAAPEIPVMVTGHAHRGMPAALQQDGRVAVRVKAYGEELGRLELKVDVPRKAVVSWNWKRVSVDSRTVRPAAGVAKLVEHWEAKVNAVVDTPIGEASRTLSKPEVKRLIERAMTDELGVDLAFMNPGGTRDVLPKGRLLARHVWNVMPFDNLVVIGKFKGRRLPESVTQGRPFDPEREYTLAVSDFTAVNQSSPTELASHGLVFDREGPLLRDLLIDWIKKKKVIP